MNLRVHRSRARLAAVTALTVALGLGVTAAAASDTDDDRTARANVPNGSVTTKKLHDGAVTTKKLRNKAVRAAKVANGSIPKPKLAPGLRTRWAAVAADGSILAQSGGITLTSHSIGQYTLRFPQAVQGKALIATPIDPDVSRPPTGVGVTSFQVQPCGSGPISSTSCGGGSAHVARVRSYLGYNQADAPFYIVVLT